MKKEIQIRLANIEDFTKLIAVGDALFDFPVKKERAIEFLNDSRHHLVIAILEGKIVGMASGIHYVHPDKNPSMFIDEVSVLEENRGQGIARRMIEKLKEHAQVLGCESAWVLTEIDNIPAQKAYKAAGGTKALENPIIFEYNLTIKH